jgi:hypothetical protein
MFTFPGGSKDTSYDADERRETNAAAGGERWTKEGGGECREKEWGLAQAARRGRFERQRR